MKDTTLQFGFLDKESNECIDEENSFGIIRAEIPEMPSKYEAAHFVIAVDESGSMNELCKDGRTKIHHIRKTIICILDYFLQTSRDTGQIHYVSLIGFSNTAKYIFVRKLVDETLICTLPVMLGTLKPGGTTSFESAFKLTSEALSLTLPDVGGKLVQRVNIFMTDGLITAGNKNINYLKNLYIKHDVPHLLIGVGKNIKYEVLRSLARVPRGSCYFIENIENIGLVYGEILHNCLYEIYRNAVIRGTNIEIYNFETNSWVNELKISSLSSGKTRVWQIRKTSNTLDNQAVVISLEYQLVNEQPEPLAASGEASAFAQALENDILDYSPRTYTILSRAFSKDNLYGCHKEIKKYWWRQRSQEITNQVQTFFSETRWSNIKNTQSDTFFDIESIQNMLESFLADMKLYMKNTPDLENDLFMQSLCDDIYINILGLGSTIGEPYIQARQDSSGNERAYNMTDIEELRDNSNIEISPTHTNHKLNRSATTTYASDSTIQIMRSCSGDIKPTISNTNDNWVLLEDKPSFVTAGPKELAYWEHLTGKKILTQNKESNTSVNTTSFIDKSSLNINYKIDDSKIVQHEISKT